MIEEVRVNEMASCCDVGVNMPQDINNFGFLPNIYSRRNKQNLFSQDRKAVFAQGNLLINLLSYLQKTLHNSVVTDFNPRSKTVTVQYL